MEELKHDQHYTYADYMSWGEDVHCEIIDGIVYEKTYEPNMSAPSRLHQEISGELYFQLRSFLKNKTCNVFYAPFDVRLDANDNDDTIVQPDIAVVCDKSKLDDHGCIGAPDLIIEILSPSTASYDCIIKLNKYLQAGVREYWIAHPESKTVTTHILNDKHYITSAYGENETINVRVLDGCSLNLKEVFAER